MVSFIRGRRLAGTALLTIIMAMLLMTGSPQASYPLQAYNPQITVSPEHGPAGTQVTVTGTGWGPISVPIWIGFANEVARGNPDSKGEFTVSFTIPDSASAGELRISAIIGNGGSADAIFTVSPPVAGEYSMSMVGAITLEPDAPDDRINGHEKTTFHPGDTIWYTGLVRNSGQEPVDAYFTWLGKYNDPEIGVEIFSNKSAVTVLPGYYSYYSPGIVPSNAAGPYLNKVTVVVGTEKFVKESRFEIAGGGACMFNAPDFSLDSNEIGHVGWGFKTGLGDEWEYGATEGTSTSDNWIKKGTRAEMLAEFGSRPHYTRYTCRPWPWIWSSPSEADKAARDGQARAYDVYKDNDLSRAVDVLNHKYGTRMPYLDLIEFLDSNYYFESLPNDHKGGGHPTRWTPITPLNPVTEATPTPPVPKPVPTPTPPRWLSPEPSFLINSERSLYLAARASPPNLDDPAIDHVNFTARWPGVDWLVVCTASQPTQIGEYKDVYQCNWDLPGVPNGPLTVSYNTYNEAGDSSIAPDGIRQGMVQLDNAYQAVEWDDTYSKGRKYKLKSLGLVQGCKPDESGNWDWKYEITITGKYNPDQFRIYSTDGGTQEAFKGKSVMGVNLTNASQPAFLCIGNTEVVLAGGPEKVESKLFVWLQ